MTVQGIPSRECEAGVVRRIAEKVNQGLDVTSCDLEELRHLAFGDRGNQQPIPNLTRSYLKWAVSGSIVKYRGFVQDMLDPEYFVGDLNGKKMHYRDVVEGDQDVSCYTGQRLEERVPLVVVPTPFASKWLATAGSDERENEGAQTSQDMAVASPQTSRKRTREELVSSSSRTKHWRSREACEDMDLGQDSNALGQSMDWWSAGFMGSDPGHCPVLAKMYYDRDDSQPRHRLNDAVEFVGVLSLDLTEGSPESEEQEVFFDEGFGRLRLPPPSLLPRLHVLCSRSVDIEEFEGKTREDWESATLEQPSLVMSEELKSRAHAIQVLSETVTGGNRTVAEALAMTLLSMAEREKINEIWSPISTPQSATLGCASLGIVMEDSSACSAFFCSLCTALRLIVPVVAAIEFSKSEMELLLPKKNPEGRLVPSLLQLPKGSTVVINLGSRSDIKDEETLAALKSLAMQHSLPYDFDGMKYSFEADYRVIVIGTVHNKHLLPCSIYGNLGSGSGVCRLTESGASAVRAYLLRCRAKNGRSNNIPITKDMLEQAQYYFVQKRVACREKQIQQVDEKDFHRWLTLARLQARSRIADDGIETTAASVVDWERAIKLDELLGGSNS